MQPILATRFLFIYFLKCGTLTEASIVQKSLRELQINVFHSFLAQHFMYVQIFLRRFNRRKCVHIRRIYD